jgi:hypothetical protein
MKKLVFITILILGVLCFSSCKGKSKEIEKEEVEKVDVDTVDYSMIEEETE